MYRQSYADGYDSAAIARPAQKASRPRAMASAAVGNLLDRAAITSRAVIASGAATAADHDPPTIARQLMIAFHSMR